VWRKSLRIAVGRMCIRSTAGLTPGSKRDCQWIRNKLSHKKAHKSQNDFLCFMTFVPLCTLGQYAEVLTELSPRSLESSINRANQGGTQQRKPQKHSVR